MKLEAEGLNDKLFASPVRIKLSDWLDNDMIVRTMIDLLQMGYINSLPKPLFCALLRRQRIAGEWPVHDIDVEAGLNSGGGLDVEEF